MTDPPEESVKIFDTNKTTLSFFTLPRELRDSIYKGIVADTPRVEHVDPLWGVTLMVVKKPLVLNLLLVSRKFHDEYLPEATKGMELYHLVTTQGLDECARHSMIPRTILGKIRVAHISLPVCNYHGFCGSPLSIDNLTKALRYLPSVTDLEVSPQLHGFPSAEVMANRDDGEDDLSTTLTKEVRPQTQPPLASLSHRLRRVLKHDECGACLSSFKIVGKAPIPSSARSNLDSPLHDQRHGATVWKLTFAAC